MKLSTSYAFMNGDSVKNALKNVAIMRETSLWFILIYRSRAFIIPSSTVMGSESSGNEDRELVFLLKRDVNRTEACGGYLVPGWKSACFMVDNHSQLD